MADSYRIHNKATAERVAELVRGLNVDSKQWTVTVKRYQKQRSLPQNALMWKWYTIIGNHLGYDKDEMHDVLREKFLPWTELELCGVKVKRLTSTSSDDFTVAMEAEYLSAIDRFAAQELGIILPHPEDEFYESLQR
jgi:hypothetical protein